MDLENTEYSEEFILLVDDEESVRESLAEMLIHLGFKVQSAGTGQEALKALKETDFTFLVTDMKMPEMGGLELITRVRDLYPYVCTIAMTGYSAEYSYVDVINAGATDFINKPFGIQELEAKMKRTIIERNIKQELNRLSITDSLTGLYNQGHFHRRLKEEINRAQRQRNQLALIMVDLDDFKVINDQFGHLSGDELLKKVGRIINKVIREGVDSSYRYGGDEFAIILIDADAAIARPIANRIVTAIEGECGVTASAGYATFTPGTTPDQFLHKADKHLYMVKAHKKDRQYKIEF